MAITIPGFSPTREVKQVDGGWVVTVTPPRFMGGIPVHVLLTDDQYRRYQLWQTGSLIQEVLYDLPVEEREMLMSGLDQETWDKMFKEDE